MSGGLIFALGIALLVMPADHNIRDEHGFRQAAADGYVLAQDGAVITFGITAFLLALAYRSWTELGSDEVEDDAEDRRIADLGAHRS